MKFLITFFSFLIFITCSSAQLNPVLTSTQQMRLNGKVKMIIDTSIIVQNEDDKEVFDTLSIHVMIFDAKGNMETDRYYDKSGMILSSTSYTYNQKGLRTGYTSVDENNKMTTKATFEYDDNNFIVKQNNVGKPFDYTDIIEYKIKDGIRTEIRKRDGKYFDSTIVTLNTDNTVKLKVTYKNDKIISKDEYSYSPNSKFPVGIKSEYYKSRCESKYDFAGNEISSKCEGGSASTYNYYFDKLNNWIETVTLYKGIEASAMGRTITYYK